VGDRVGSPADVGRRKHVEADRSSIAVRRLTRGLDCARDTNDGRALGEALSRDRGQAVALGEKTWLEPSVSREQPVSRDYGL
jgi:hypothetical protein